MKKIIAVLLLLSLPSFAPGQLNAQAMPSLPYSQPLTVVGQQNIAAMGRIANRGLGYRLRTGDLFEGATRLELEAAMLRDSGFDRTIQNSANWAALRTITDAQITRIQSLLAKGNVNVDRATVRTMMGTSRERRRAITHMRQVGFYNAMIQAARLVRLAAKDSAKFSLTSFNPSAHPRLLEVLAQSQCDGLAVAGAAAEGYALILAVIPGGQEAAAVAALAGGFLMMLHYMSAC